MVHRQESSGTTGNFTKFLDLASGQAASGVWLLGSGSTVEWSPDTKSGTGNGQVAQVITSTDGAIGYVDLADAVKAKLTFASVKNKAGKFVAPTLDAASAAVAGATIAADLTFSAIWATGDAAYPITAQTWLITYATQTNKGKGTSIREFVRYLLTDGQTFAPSVNYAPLPVALATEAIAQLDQIVLPA